MLRIGTSARLQVMLLATLALAVTASGTAGAQDGGQNKSDERAEQPVVEGKIAGKVVNSMFEPIPDAILEVRDQSRKVIAKTRTDMAGKFIVSGLPLKPLSLWATWDGMDWSCAHKTPSPHAGRPAQVEIRCFAAAQVSGVVKDLDGKPIVGAQVTGSFDTSRQHDASIHEYAETVTDRAGRYSLAKVPLGDVCIRVSSHGFRLGEASLFLAVDATADLVLKRGDGRRVQVIVEGVPADRLAGIQCSLTVFKGRVLGLPRRLLSGTLDEEGVWDVRGLPEDIDFLRVSVHGQRIRFVQDSLTWNRAPDKADQERFEFKVEKIWGGGPASGGAEAAVKKPGSDSEKGEPKPIPELKTFHGVLKTKRGKPIAKASIYLHSPSLGWLRTRTTADGSFTLEARFAAGETVMLNLYDREWVLARNRALRKGESPNGGVTFKFNATKKHQLRAMPSASVSGVVLNPKGKPSPDTWVALERDYGSSYFRPGQYRYQVGGAWTDEKGKFRISGLHELDKDLWLTVNDPHGYGEKGPLKGKGKRTLKAQKIRLVKPSIVEGSVTGPRGKPIAGARVEVLPWDIPKSEPASGDSQQTLTDREGRFRIRRLKAGEYALLVRVRGPKALGKKNQFKLAKGRTIKRRIRLRKL